MQWLLVLLWWTHWYRPWWRSKDLRGAENPEGLVSVFLLWTNFMVKFSWSCYWICFYKLVCSHNSHFLLKSSTLLHFFPLSVVLTSQDSISEFKNKFRLIYSITIICIFDSPLLNCYCSFTNFLFLYLFLSWRQWKTLAKIWTRLGKKVVFVSLQLYRNLQVYP